MTTYVLSQHASYWHVTRYADDQSEPLSRTENEEDALQSILERAMCDRPSQILRINLDGDSRVIAKLENDALDLEQLQHSDITVSPAVLAALREERGRHGTLN